MGVVFYGEGTIMQTQRLDERVYDFYASLRRLAMTLLIISGVGNDISIILIRYQSNFQGFVCPNSGDHYNKVHIGVGVKLSNLKSDKSLITIMIDGVKVDTGLKKMGAVIGDRVEVGCNAVLNPGTVIGNDSNVYPLTNVRGYVGEKCIVKSDGSVVKKR